MMSELQSLVTFIQIHFVILRIIELFTMKQHLLQVFDSYLGQFAFVKYSSIGGLFFSLKSLKVHESCLRAVYWTVQFSSSSSSICTALPAPCGRSLPLPVLPAPLVSWLLVFFGLFVIVFKADSTEFCVRHWKKKIQSSPLVMVPPNISPLSDHALINQTW